MANTIIKTSGMHCTSCEMLVKDELEEQEGVSKADASHKEGIVSVEFDETKTTEAQIRKIIKNQGYEVE